MRLSMFVLLMSLFHILISTEVALFNPQYTFNQELISKYREFKQHSPNTRFKAYGDLLYVEGYDGELFVALSTNNGPHLIAYGKDLNIDFSNELICFQEAYNLKGKKKCLYNLKYIFTLPCLGYVKYVKCMLKVIECFAKCMFCCWDELMERTQGCSPYEFVCFFILIIVLTLIYFVFILLGVAVSYQVAIFPFQAMAFPLLYYSFGVDCISFGFLPTTFASLFVLFFPQIKKFPSFDWRRGSGCRNEFQILSNRFQVKPMANNMHLLSLLIQKKRSGCEDFKHTLKFCLCIYLCGCLLMCVYCPLMD